MISLSVSGNISITSLSLSKLLINSYLRFIVTLLILIPIALPLLVDLRILFSLGLAGIFVIEVFSCPNDSGQQVIVKIQGIRFVLFTHRISSKFLVLVNNLCFFKSSWIVLIAAAGVHLIFIIKGGPRGLLYSEWFGVCLSLRLTWLIESKQVLELWLFIAFIVT